MTVLTVLKSLNLAVRLGLEVVLLGTVAVTAWRSAGPGPLGWLAAAAVPLAVAVAWVAVVHGEHVPGAVRVLGQLVALGGAVACLVSLGAPRAAAVVTGTALLNAALLVVWNQ